MKPWNPIVKNPGSTFLHEQYGITETRRVELSIRMTKMAETSDGITITPVANHIAQIAEFTDSAAEFAFCVFVHAVYLEQRQALLT